MVDVDNMYRLFLEREQLFQECTLVILSQIKFVTDGIKEYLELAPGDISWSSVEIIGHEMFVVVSIPSTDRFQYVPPGTSGTKTLTIVLPLSVIEAGDSHLIADYLIETEDVRQNDHLIVQDEPETPTGVVGLSNSFKKIIH